MSYRINRALRSLGLPPLIVDRDDPGTQRMGRWAARWYVLGFSVANALGFAVVALKASHGRF